MNFTKKQGIVITGFTGLLACPWDAFHEDVEKRLGRPVFTHEFAEKPMWEEVKEAYKEDFLAMCQGTDHLINLAYHVSAYIRENDQWNAQRGLDDIIKELEE